MNKTLKTFLIAALTLLASFPAFADTAAPIDIYEAIDLTLKNNSGLRSLRQEVLKAQAFKLQADGTLLPNIAANAYIDRQKEDQTTDGSTRYDNRVARATIEQTVYSGGKNSALRRQSGQVKTIADMMIADGENGAVGELFARFYNVLLQRERINAEESAVKTSETHLAEVGKMSELGLANRLEVIRAGQQLATNTANLSAARGLYEAAHISLMNYMAIPPEERRPVTGVLRIPEIDGNRADSLALASRFRADMKRLEEQVKYQKNQIEIEKSGMRPKVALGASGGYLDPYRNADRSDDTWRAELSVSVPIFDRNAARSGVMKANAVLEQDKISLEQKELDIKSDVETAWTEIETSKRSMDASAKALELAEESLRLAEVGYREGVTPQLDLLNAQTSLTSARLDYLRSQYSHLLTIIALKVTEGTIVNWTGERKF